MYIKRNKQQILLEQDKRIFRTSELAILWGIVNKNTLLTTISRYVKRGILTRIKKGVYSTVSLVKLDPYELGCAFAGPLSYISCETVLSSAGVMMQVPIKITLMGKKAGEWEVGGNRYWCRYADPRYLVDRDGVEDGVQYSIANVVRAERDLRRSNQRVYLDRESYDTT